MSSSDVLGRLEQRAALAENIIATLTKQLAQLQGSTLQSKKDELKRSNQELSLQVDSLKKKLINLETQNGVKQYYDFTKNVSTSTPPPPPKEVSTPSPPPAVKEVLDNTATTQSSKPPTPTDKKDKPKKEKKSGGGAKKPEIVEAAVDVARLDFRVGRIITASKHPDADSLYVEEVDAGEDKTRTVVSGLVKFIPEEEMQNRLVILLCNLKPAKMRGVTSQAMVMCASTPDKVEILAPPPGSEPGDVVEFDGYVRNPDSILNPKKKVFETCVPDLRTNVDKIACYKGVPFNVPGKGNVVAQSLADVQIK